MAHRYLPRILHDAGPAGDCVLVPATLVGSASTAGLRDLDPVRAGALAGAAVRGGLWVVRGERWARVVTASALLAGGVEPVDEHDVPLLFDGERPRARLTDELDPVDLLVPVGGWEPGQSFYFHRDSPLFAGVPALRKQNHRVTVLRGDVPDGDRKVMGRRMVEGQTCGILANELGGLCVVPDGEVATEVRALHAERVRFIVVTVLRGSLPGSVGPLLAATVEDDPTVAGEWGLCRGAFGYVLAELGAPLRAIESLSSSVSYAHLLDGCTHLGEAADRLREVADRLDRLAGAGWTLSQPIAGFWLRLRPSAPFQ